LQSFNHKNNIGWGGKGRETKKMQKVHIKMENVPRFLSKVVAYLD